MKYIKLSFKDTDASTREILVAVLAEEGFESFEEDGDTLHAYIKEEDYHEGIAAITEEIYSGAVVMETIEQQNWNAVWEQGFQPVTVEEFCTIRAGFHAADETVQYEIVITPKMSFGTGHHATTRLVIRQMREIEIKGKEVLDFGTGTGVLAILAKKMGAVGVTAIDNDEWSYENTLENIKNNSVTGIEVMKGSLEAVVGKKFDIILANINRHILLQYMQGMQGLLRPGGSLVMSGILDADEAIICAAAGKTGLTVASVTHEDKWTCIHAALA